MKNLLRPLTILCVIVLFSSCKKDHSNDSSVNPYDADALQFLTSSGITDTVQKNAINNFVVQLKSNSLWTKFLAIYPMAGGTAATTKWNLKDPRDLDVAYRITWNGSPAFQNSGVTCLTTTDWGDTHLADNALLYNNSSISYYSGTTNQVAGYDMGCRNQVSPYNIMAIYENFSEDIVNTWFNGYGSTQYQPTVTAGLFMNSSNDSQVVRYENGIPVAHYGAPANSYTNDVITIGKIVDDSYMGLKECRLATIGSGLTDSEALEFYNIVQDFEKRMNR